MNRPARDAPVEIEGKVSLFRRERQGCDGRIFRRQASFETEDPLLQPKLFFLQRGDLEIINARMLFEAFHLEIEHCVSLAKCFNSVTDLTQKQSSFFPCSYSKV